jgi:hypothetical protein
MKINKKAESLTWIIIAVFILAITMIWIVNILSHGKDTENNYWENIDLIFLESSAENIVKNTNLSSIWVGEVFYIYKNTWSNLYEASTDSTYKLVNKFWDNVFGDFEWNIYERSFVKNVREWSIDDNIIEYIDVEINIKKQ